MERELKDYKFLKGGCYFIVFSLCIETPTGREREKGQFVEEEK